MRTRLPAHYNNIPFFILISIQIDFNELIKYDKECKSRRGRRFIGAVSDFLRAMILVVLQYVVLCTFRPALRAGDIGYAVVNNLCRVREPRLAGNSCKQYKLTHDTRTLTKY